MVTFTSAKKAITSVATTGFKSAASAAGTALEFYVHNLEVQDPEFARKRRQEAKTQRLAELGESPGAVQMTTFKPKKSRKETRAARNSRESVRKVHSRANPAICAACKNQSKNVRTDADSNNGTREARIVVDQAHLESWVHIVQVDCKVNIEGEIESRDTVKESNGWEKTTLYGACEPPSKPTTSSSNALDNANLARDGLALFNIEDAAELEPIPDLSRNDSNTSDNSVLSPRSPEGGSSPRDTIARPGTSDMQNDFETISLGLATKSTSQITTAERSDGLDNASLHRDIQQLRFAHGASVEHNPESRTTTTITTIPSPTSTLRTRLFPTLYTTFSPSTSGAVITASTAITPLLHHHHYQISPIYPESSYTTTSSQETTATILSTKNCQILHSHQTIFISEPLPYRSTHDSLLSPFLLTCCSSSSSPSSSSSVWISSSTLGQVDDFCAHEIVRNMQHARDEAEGVFELGEWKKMGKNKENRQRKYGSELQEEEDRKRDRFRLRKANGSELEGVMGQEVFGRMF